MGAAFYQISGPGAGAPPARRGRARAACLLAQHHHEVVLLDLLPLLIKKWLPLRECRPFIAPTTHQRLGI